MERFDASSELLRYISRYAWVLQLRYSFFSPLLLYESHTERVSRTIQRKKKVRGSKDACNDAIQFYEEIYLITTISRNLYFKNKVRINIAGLNILEEYF